MEIIIAVLLVLVFAGGGLSGIVPGSYGFGVGQVAPPPPAAPPTGSVLPTSTVPSQIPSSSSTSLPALAGAGCSAAKIPGGACQLYVSKLESDVKSIFDNNAPGIFATLQQKAATTPMARVSVAGPGGVSLWVGKPPGSTQAPPPRTAAAAAYPAVGPGALSRNLQ